MLMLNMKIEELSVEELRSELMSRLQFEMMCTHCELKMLIFTNQENDEELLINNYSTLRALLEEEAKRMRDNTLPGWEDYAEGQARVFELCVVVLDKINEGK